MTNSALVNKPPNGAVDKDLTAQNPGWPSFFSTVWAILNAITRSGSTSERPTSKEFRWIGMQFYDQTLGYPVYLNAVNPDVWHNGAGVPV